jgi:hypothetical protein
LQRSRLASEPLQLRERRLPQALDLLALETK